MQEDLSASSPQHADISHISLRVWGDVCHTYHIDTPLKIKMSK